MLITVSETIPNPPIQLPAGSTATLRGYYSERFLDSDGVTVVMPGNGLTGFYYEVACTVNDDGNLVVPAFEIHTTDDGVDVATSRFTGQLFVDGVPNVTIFGFPNSVTGWIIPAAFGEATTWNDLDIFNQGRALLSAPSTYLTAAQTVALILSLAVSAVEGLENLTVDTTGLVQFGDISNAGNSSYLDVDDSGGRADLFAGGGSGEQYAGVAAVCDDESATIYIQSTDYTHLRGQQDGVTTLGDALEGHNGTQVRIDDDASMVMSRTMNAVPDDAKIGAEEVCFYLDENDGKLKVRIRKSEGTYATAELAYVDD